MPKQAKLPDGTVLNFPDDATDAEMDAAVNQHAQNAPTISGRYGPVLGSALGAIDLIGTGGAQVANQGVRLMAGLGTGIGQAVSGGSFSQGYKEGRQTETLIPQSEEQLSTPEGRALAAKIQHLPIGFPSATTGEIPRVSDIGTAIQNVGAGIERIGGPEVGPAMKDTAGMAASIMGMRLGNGGRPATAASEAVGKAEQLGYRAPLTTPLGEGQYVGGRVDRAAAGLAGGEAVNARVQVMNQEVTQSLGARAIQLQDAADMNPASVIAKTEAANKAYSQLKALDVQVPLNTQTYYQGVVNLNRRVKGFDDLPHAQVEALQHVLLTAHPTIPNVIDKVLDLRSRAYDAFQAGDRVYGTALREGADLLDDSLDEFLKNAAASTSNPNLRAQLSRLYPAYVQARAELATLHDVRDAMNPTTGTLDAKTITDIVNERPPGRPTNPNLKQIADAYNALGPDGMRNVARAAKIAGRPLTATDAAIGALAGAHSAALAGSGPGGTAAGIVIGALAPAVARGILRNYALRSPGGALDVVGKGVRHGIRGVTAEQFIPTDQQ